MPFSRPLPMIGRNCHELRINDGNVTWRIIYRIDTEVILVVDVFKKKTETLPTSVIKTCIASFRWYDLQED